MHSHCLPYRSTQNQNAGFPLSRTLNETADRWTLSRAPTDFVVTGQGLIVKRYSNIPHTHADNFLIHTTSNVPQKKCETTFHCGEKCHRPICTRWSCFLLSTVVYFGFDLFEVLQWLASQRDAQITHAFILTDSMNLKGRVWNGLPQLAHSHAQVFDYKDICGSTVLGTPESAVTDGQIDWQAQQISHLVCSLAGQRCSEA